MRVFWRQLNQDDQCCQTAETSAEHRQIRQSLRVSFIEGVFAAVMVGFTQEFFTPFVLFLGGGAGHIGLLNALPNLSAALLQTVSPEITARMRSRRAVITLFVLLQALMLAPLAWFAWRGTAPLSLVIGAVVLFTACGSLAQPAWGSLMADLVPPEQRGSYFGWRNRALGFVTVAALLSAGGVLQVWKSGKGFFVLFVAAISARLISWHFLRGMHEPPLRHGPEHAFSLWQFFRRLRESNFAKFVVFVALMSFSANIASPFFSVLMLKELGFSYLLFSAVTMTATLTIFSSIARWGRHADRVGNVRIIRFVAPLIGVIPLLWVICRHPLYLFAAQVVSGFVWSGFNLCTANFIYDAVSAEKRARCIAYFNLCNGMAICSGALLGAFLLPRLPLLFGYRFLSLCCVSAALRLMVGFFLPPLLREVRPVDPLPSDRLFFSMIGIRPLVGVERKTIRF